MLAGRLAGGLRTVFANAHRMTVSQSETFSDEGIRDSLDGIVFMLLESNTSDEFNHDTATLSSKGAASEGTVTVAGTVVHQWHWLRRILDERCARPSWPGGYNSDNWTNLLHRLWRRRFAGDVSVLGQP